MAGLAGYAVETTQAVLLLLRELATQYFSNQSVTGDNAASYYTQSWAESQEEGALLLAAQIPIMMTAGLPTTMFHGDWPLHRRVLCSLQLAPQNRCQVLSSTSSGDVSCGQSQPGTGLR